MTMRTAVSADPPVLNALFRAQTAPDIPVFADGVAIVGAIVPDELVDAIEREGEALVARAAERLESPAGDGRQPQPRSRSDATKPPTDARIPQDLTRSRTLREIRAHPENVTPPVAVVPGVAWRGRITMVSAREGVGKSTWFSAAAAAVTRGDAFLGAPCLKGVVLWVLVEEALPDLTLRAIRFQTDDDQLRVLERPELPLASLLAEVDQHRPVLVVVDTLHRFASAERRAARSRATDVSTSEAWAPIMEAFDLIARRSNAAILMSAQAVKATGEYRDSTEIGHGVDVTFKLVRPDHASPVRRLEKDKGRIPCESMTFELCGDAFVCGGTVAKKLSKQRQKVIAALEPPMTFSEWEAAADVPETTFKRTVKYLLDEGYVAKSPNDTYVEGPKGHLGATGPTAPLSTEGPPRPPAVGGDGGPSDPTGENDAPPF